MDNETTEVISNKASECIAILTKRCTRSERAYNEERAEKEERLAYWIKRARAAEAELEGERK